MCLCADLGVNLGSVFVVGGVSTELLLCPVDFYILSRVKEMH